jgi:hypothetical protein
MSAWQNFVKQHMGPGETLKSLAVQYRSQDKGASKGPAKKQAKEPHEDKLKLHFITTCEGDCSKHVSQLNVYIKYLHNVLSDRVLDSDSIPNTQQIVFFCNLFLVNLATYLTENHGSPINFTDARIGKAVVKGNKIADKALLFRTNFFRWMGTPKYVELLNSIRLGCAANTTKDMKNDYIIKISCIAYGLQLLFEDSDVQEVFNYMDGSWFPNFLSNLSGQILSVTDECSPKVSVVRKGLRVIKSVGKSIVYIVPKVAKAAWYTGRATWYTGKRAADIVGKIPGVKTAMELLLTLGQIQQEIRFFRNALGI